MALPLEVIKAALEYPVMVELKNGDTLSGILSACDGFMNLKISDLVCTSRDGDSFLKIPVCYVRGNNVKYLRLPDEVYEKALTSLNEAREQKQKTNQINHSHGRGRGSWKSNTDFHTSGRGRAKRSNFSSNNSKFHKSNDPLYI